MTPSGIEPTTCRFVAYCLNHYATAHHLIYITLPNWWCTIKQKSNRPSVYYKQKILYINLTPPLASPSTITVWWSPLITLQRSCSCVFIGRIPRRFRSHAHMQCVCHCHRMLRAKHCPVFMPMQKQMTSWHPRDTKGCTARSWWRISEQPRYCVLPRNINLLEPEFYI